MANERLISKGKAHSIPTVAQFGRVAVGDQMRGTPMMLSYLERTIPLAARIDAPLARFFGGARVSELMAQARTRLAQADTAQETARAALPADTAAVLERKGRILDLVTVRWRAGFPLSEVRPGSLPWKRSLGMLPVCLGGAEDGMGA